MIINQSVVGGLSSEKIFFAFPFNFNEIFFFLLCNYQHFEQIDVPNINLVQELHILQKLMK